MRFCTFASEFIDADEQHHKTHTKVLVRLITSHRPSAKHNMAAEYCNLSNHLAPGNNHQLSDNGLFNPPVFVVKRICQMSLQPCISINKCWFENEPSISPDESFTSIDNELNNHSSRSFEHKLS